MDMERSRVVSISRTALPRVVLVCAALAGVSACNRKDTRLPGERVAPEEALALAMAGDGTTAEAPEAANPAMSMGAPRPIAVGGSVANADWPQRAGSASHDAPQPALGAAPVRIWAANVGAGDSRKLRITADPVVAGGRVFTLDADSAVTATSTGGGIVWRQSLVPASERGGDAGGGGLAYGEGMVFATTGYGELVALDPASGAVRWRQRFDSPLGGAPTVAGGKVYVAARNGTATAVSAANGKLLWQLPALPKVGGVAGVSAPAVSGKFVLFPFASGHLIAADAETGGVVWQAFVEGNRAGRAFASVPDFTADPVIQGQTVYVGTAAGRIAALDLLTGAPLWTAREGAQSPVVVAGGSVFAVNDENQLIRLDAGSGELVWRVDLPYFTRDRLKKRRDIFAHFGPILAGGRLVVASSDGVLRSFDPASGALVHQTALAGGAAANAAVAGGTLFVLGRNGQLQAFR